MGPVYCENKKPSDAGEFFLGGGGGGAVKNRGKQIIFNSCS
jgi:hypothetical protein